MYAASRSFSNLEQMLWRDWTIVASSRRPAFTVDLTLRRCLVFNDLRGFLIAEPLIRKAKGFSTEGTDKGRRGHREILENGAIGAVRFDLFLIYHSTRYHGRKEKID
jgi:hypothetical protein